MTPAHLDKFCSLCFHTPFLSVACPGRKKRKNRKISKILLEMALGCLLTSCSSLVLYYFQPPVPFPLLPIISNFFSPHFATNRCLVKASGYLPRCLPTWAVMAHFIKQGSMSNPEATRKSMLSASTKSFIF